MTQHLPQQGFCTVFGVNYQFLGFSHPHHPGYLCYVENRTRRRFARRIQQDFQFLQRKPENSQLKLKVTTKPNSHFSFQQGFKHGVLGGHLQVGKHLGNQSMVITPKDRPCAVFSLTPGIFFAITWPCHSCRATSTLTTSNGATSSHHPGKRGEWNDK